MDRLTVTHGDDRLGTEAGIATQHAYSPIQRAFYFHPGRPELTLIAAASFSNTT